MDINKFNDFLDGKMSDKEVKEFYETYGFNTDYIPRTTEERINDFATKLASNSGLLKEFADDVFEEMIKAQIALFERFNNARNPIPNEWEKINNFLDKLPEDSSPEEVAKILDGVLGESIDKRFIKDDGKTYEEIVWVGESGLIIRRFELSATEASKVEDEVQPSMFEGVDLTKPVERAEYTHKKTVKKEKNLKEQLDDAIKTENYELAAVLRDKIKDEANQ